MKRTSIILAAACTLLGVLSSEAGAQVPPLPSPEANVALGATVELQGTFGNGNAGIALPKSIVDDRFLPSGTPWTQGTVWWDETDGQPRSIVLTLRGQQRITAFTVQADCNDVYELSFWDNLRQDWAVAWSVPTSICPGMRTRPDAANDNRRYALKSPIFTEALRLRVTSGDGLNSVSEIRAFGGPA